MELTNTAGATTGGGMTTMEPTTAGTTTGGWITTTEPTTTEPTTTGTTSSATSGSTVGPLCDKGEYAGDFTAETTAELDALEGYTSITGNLKISPVFDDLVETGALNCLRGIGGGLVLTSQFLDPSPTQSVIDAAGLAAVTDVGGGLDVHFVGLASEHGLAQIETVGGGVRFKGVGTDVSDLLPKLTTVGDRFEIRETGFTQLDGFDALTAVQGDLAIQVNDELVGLGVFSQLTTIGGVLYVEYNPKLTALAPAFPALTSAASLVVYNNDVLSDCDAKMLADQIGVPCDCPNCP